MKIKFKLLIVFFVIVIGTVLYMNPQFLGIDPHSDTLTFSNVMARIDSFLSDLGFRPDPQEAVRFGDTNYYELNRTANRTTGRYLESNILDYTNEPVIIKGEVLWKDVSGGESEYLLLTQDGFAIFVFEEEWLIHDITEVEVDNDEIKTDRMYEVLGVFKGRREHNSLHYHGNVPYVEARHVKEKESERVEED